MRRFHIFHTTDVEAAPSTLSLVLSFFISYSFHVEMLTFPIKKKSCHSKYMKNKMIKQYKVEK